jgi:hypothetical protein
MYFDVAPVIETGYKILSVSIENIKVGRISFLLPWQPDKCFVPRERCIIIFRMFIVPLDSDSMENSFALGVLFILNTYKPARR